MRDTIFSYFVRQVRENAQNIAVVDPYGTLNYEGFSRCVAGIAAKFPITRPRRVGIIMDHCAEMIASMFAVVSTGASYIPVEPSFPEGRIAYMFNEGDVDFVITSSANAHLANGCPCVVIEPGERPHSPSRLDNLASPDDIAYILYTSGTEGWPKGVMIRNRNVCNYVRGFVNEFKCGPGDVVLQNAVCSFDMFEEEVFCTLLSGAALAIPNAEERSSFENITDFAERNDVSIIMGFPYVALELNKREILPPKLRLLLSGGDVLREAYIDHLLGNVDIYNTYGPTETTMNSTFFKCEDGAALPDGTYPIGKAIENTIVTIVGPDGAEVPAGAIGEIRIAGAGVGAGYLNLNPESANFITLSDGSPAYLTGDLGYRLPDGNIAFIRRKDQQVMIRGMRVECDEVEACLRADRFVKDGVVCSFIDAQGLAYLVAYIVPNSEAFSLRDLKIRMKQNLPDFMIPEFFVLMRSIPATEDGKVDRLALPVVLKDSSI